MEEKKKLYEAPQMKVPKMDAASIICASGAPQFKTEQLQEEEYNWN